MHASTEPLVIDVVSDVVCPWCFIGKRHLEAALAGVPEAAGARVLWHPVSSARRAPPSPWEPAH